MKAGEGDDRGWDGWMASPTWWTWVWASSGNWWWTGKPGVLQSMGLQRTGHDWMIELNWEARWNQYKHKKNWLAHVTWKSKRVVLTSGTAGSRVQMLLSIFFHVLALGNSAAVEMGVRVSFWIIVFSSICAGVGLLDYMAILFLVFWGTSILFSVGKWKWSRSVASDSLRPHGL